jgi:hypothetical protein
MLSYIIYIYIYIVCELYNIYICLNHSWLIPVNPQDWLIGHVPIKRKHHDLFFLPCIVGILISQRKAPGQVVVVRVLLALPGELLSALQLGSRHRGR